MPQNAIDYNQVDLTQTEDWVKLQDLPSHFSQFEQRQVANLMRTRHQNGMDGIVRKVGKFLYINKRGVGYWMAHRS